MQRDFTKEEHALIKIHSNINLQFGNPTPNKTKGTLLLYVMTDKYIPS